jgi:hypothetical protein
MWTVVDAVPVDGARKGAACHSPSGPDAVGVARSPFALVWSLASRYGLIQLLSNQAWGCLKTAAQVARQGLACPGRRPGNLGRPVCEPRHRTARLRRCFRSSEGAARDPMTRDLTRLVRSCGSKATSFCVRLSIRFGNLTPARFAWCGAVFLGQCVLPGA